MLARQSNPIEMSSPNGVESPLWQAIHRSDVWKIGPFTLCGDSAPRRIPSVETRTIQTEMPVPLNTPSLLFPTFAETAIKPIPQQIEHDLSRPRHSVGDRKPDPHVCQDVLAFTQRHLELRHDIPIGFRCGLQVSVGQEFDHRRPAPAKAMILSQRLADGGSPEHGPRSLVGVSRQLGSRLDLDKTHPRKQLPVCRESLERGDTTPQAPVLVSRGQGDRSLHAEDGAGRQAMKQYPFE